MDISLLTAFETFARHLSFTEAAKALCMTQPTLSKQIASIEREVGVQLIDRSKQQLALTHAGAIFLEGASATLARYNKTLDDVMASTKSGGSLALTGFIYPPVQAALQTFKVKHPSVRLKIDAKSIPGRIDRILEKDVDACFGLYFQQLSHPGIIFHSLLRMPLWVIVDEKHRLAGRGRVSISDLQGESFIARYEDPEDLNFGFAMLLEAHGLTPNLEMRYPSSFIELLGDLHNCTLLWPQGLYLPGSQGARIAILEVEDPHETFCGEYGIWCRENVPNPTLTLFIEELSETLHSRHSLST
jgi:DNA-binding transcriptional LysR family regulator